MKKRLSPSLIGFLVVLVLSLVLSGCAGATAVSNQPTRPVVTITAPTNGSSFAIGQQVVIQFSAADVKGVRQVELSIDGEPARVEPVEPPVNSYVASHVWTPQTTGSHTVELHAFNVDDEASERVRIVVVVTGDGTAATTPTTSPVSPAVDTPTPLPPVASPTSAPQPVVATPSSEATTGGGPTVTTLVGLNVRSGPGTNYPVVGRLPANQTMPIVGRNPEGTWWQIVYPEGSGSRGWVSGGVEFSRASNADGVAIAEAPPPPEPTATPEPVKPVIHSFTADRYTIAPGEKVILRWDLSNAREAYLRYQDQEEGVVSPGEKTVSPKKDIVYTLVARNDGGETTAEVSIKVSGGTPTPVPVFRDGKTRMVNDQSIDFDQGVIQQGTGGSGADFYWDAAKKQFFPKSGSKGVLFDRNYDTITLDDCRTADYGQLPEINPTGRITGCYQTSEGRYGKFWISEWDATGNLTIVWQTWDVR